MLVIELFAALDDSALPICVAGHSYPSSPSIVARTEER
jgi:hypothetical protein